MIKSKIDARERALELAIKFVNGTFTNAEKTLESAKPFADFLIGSADLPEFVDESIHIRELLDFTKKEMEKINKRDTPDYAEMSRAIQTGNAGISAEMPCKSEAE